MFSLGAKSLDFTIYDGRSKKQSSGNLTTQYMASSGRAQAAEVIFDESQSLSYTPIARNYDAKNKSKLPIKTLLFGYKDFLNA